MITLVAAPGYGEVTVVTDETMAEKDPLLAKLLGAATAGAEPAGPANKRQPIRILLDPDERAVGRDALCGQTRGFNLQAAIIGRAGAARPDCAARGAGCPFGTLGLPTLPLPHAASPRPSPPPRRHTVLYCGVLSSHAASRKDVVPAPPATGVGQDKPKRRSKYIRWSELLRRVFGIETLCQTCRVPLRLISLVKSEAVAKKILTAIRLPADVPKLRPARASPHRDRDAREQQDYIN